jgi:hypothetical protein
LTADQQKQSPRNLKESGEALTAARVQLGQVQEKQLASQQQVQRQTAAKAELSAADRSDHQIRRGGRRSRGDVEHRTGRNRQAEPQLRRQQRTYAEHIESLAGAGDGGRQAVRDRLRRC